MAPSANCREVAALASRRILVAVLGDHSPPLGQALPGQLAVQGANEEPALLEGEPGEHRLRTELVGDHLEPPGLQDRLDQPRLQAWSPEDLVPALRGAAAHQP